MSLVTQSCSTLCNPMDCSPPCSSIHGLLQARILEWVAIPSPGDLPRDHTRVSCTAGGFFTICSSSQLLDEKLFERRLFLFFQVLGTRSAHRRCSHTHRMKEMMGRDVPGPTHPPGPAQAWLSAEPTPGSHLSLVIPAMCGGRGPGFGIRQI